MSTLAPTAAGLGATESKSAAEKEKNRNLVVRLLTAAVGIPITVFVVMLGGVWFASFVSFVGAATAVEFCHMSLGKNRLRWLTIITVVITPYFFLVPQLGEGKVHWLWTALAVIALTARMADKEPLDKAGPEVAAAVFGAVYCSLIAYLVPLRETGPHWSWWGSGWVNLVCILSWWCDTGAYFAGRFAGRRKLAPRISPSKTWEGFWGGLVGAVAAAFFTKLIVLPGLAPIHCVAIGLIAGVVGPIGDLAESMLKRSFNVKDSGHLLPGHGGMMDRVDGLVFNGLVVYAYYFLVLAR